eukprot:4790883-Ditylum_brightwellii.AAC.1
MTTVVHTQRYNGQWTAVATTNSCTRNEESHEDTLGVHAPTYYGKWVAVADDFKTENDNDISISSCYDSVPEPQVLPVIVIR